jgi:hypothetical protein
MVVAAAAAVVSNDDDNVTISMSWQEHAAVKTASWLV